MINELTVVVMTYNQKKYISKTMDSILSQKIGVDYLVLVHDDCSNDGTYEILLDFKNRFPNKIKLIHQNTRRFLKDGFNLMIYKYVVPHIHTKYVAYCDGDDYWCDDFKLQKQFDYMEQHNNYTMCFHSAYQLKENGDMSSRWFLSKDKDIGMEDLINDKPGICIATSSIFLRADIFVNFPEWRIAFPVEDVPMYMMAVFFGKVHCIGDVMCVYRQFALGSWSSQNRSSLEKRIKHYKRIREATSVFNEWSLHKYENLVDLQIRSCDFRVALLSEDFKIIFDKKNKSFLKQLPFKTRLLLKLKYRTPRIYNLLHKTEKD